MKKVINTIAILALVFSICTAQNAQNETKTEILFEKTVHNFGNLKYASDNGVYDFVFKNVSDKPIILTQVKSSCGCTTPQWSKKPIQPGESSSITVKYNTKIPGKFSKAVTVFSNADNSPVKLEISGDVTVTLADTEKIKAGNRAAQGTGTVKKDASAKSKIIKKDNLETSEKGDLNTTKKRKFIRSGSEEIKKKAAAKGTVIKK
ncbi:DUF1573 domain-containing protein [Bacteroidota bacterium]